MRWVDEMRASTPFRRSQNLLNGVRKLAHISTKIIQSLLTSSETISS